MEKPGWLLGMCLAAFACSGGTDVADAGMPPQGPDASVTQQDAGVVYLPDDPWCGRVASETGPAVTVTSGLSKVHARVRYFGALESVTQADDALVAALERTHGDVEERTAAEFALEIPSLCRVAPVPGSARAARVELMADVAVTRPR